MHCYFESTMELLFTFQMNRCTYPYYSIRLSSSLISSIPNIKYPIGSNFSSEWFDVFINHRFPRYPVMPQLYQILPYHCQLIFRLWSFKSSAYSYIWSRASSYKIQIITHVCQNCISNCNRICNEHLSFTFHLIFYHWSFKYS